MYKPTVRTAFKYLSSNDSANWVVFFHWNDIAKALGEHWRIVVLIQHLDDQFNLKG